MIASKTVFFNVVKKWPEIQFIYSSSSSHSQIKTMLEL